MSLFLRDEFRKDRYRAVFRRHYFTEHSDI